MVEFTTRSSSIIWAAQLVPRVPSRVEEREDKDGVRSEIFVVGMRVRIKIRTRSSELTTRSSSDWALRAPFCQQPRSPPLEKHIFCQRFWPPGVRFWDQIGPEIAPRRGLGGSREVSGGLSEPSWFRDPSWSPSWSSLGALLGSSWAILSHLDPP